MPKVYEETERSEAKGDSIRAAVIKSIRAQDRRIFKLAEQTRIDRQHIHAYVAHRRDLTGERLDRLMAALRIFLARADSNKPIKRQPLRDIIKSRFERQEWTYAKLAADSGVDKEVVRRYILGDGDSTGLRISRMLRAVGVTVQANLTKPPVPREWLETLG